MLNLHSSSIPRTTLALCPTIIRREIGQATLTNDSPLGISERDLQTDKVEAIAKPSHRLIKRQKPVSYHRTRVFGGGQADPSQNVITTATMRIVETLIESSSPKVRLALVKADLIPQIINTINPQSLSFVETDNIHINLMISITHSLSLATPDGLEDLKIEDIVGQQSVHETVLKHVLAPSEKYIWHLCVNRYSIIDGEQSRYFMELMAQLLRISPYYQPTMDFILHMPVVLTIPSCLTFFEHDHSIFWFVHNMIDAQRDWNDEGGEIHHTGRKVHRVLRMEGIEDGIEEKLRIDKNGSIGRYFVALSTEWNNLQGMNISRRALKQTRTGEHFDLFPPCFGQETLFVDDRCRLWHHLMAWFAERQRFSRQSRSMVATLSFSFAAILALLVYERQCVDRWMDGDDWWGTGQFCYSSK
ncbi:hypothetical protein BLNAU_14394 [Blattamonas nauphoetae]|uniref:Uncharacterized protein n=1 Tax=Blattamonas nauphoetae TaxID=2049346 RepID=A0ABQ9XE22_9EUKA|nr:hypothetical protein BLNAU_14394 [Blattamonas nauphoetae]